MPRLLGCALLACLSVACARSGSSGHPGETIDASAPCTAGEQRCDGQTLERCGDDGAFHASETCPEACSPAFGCTTCVPGTATCDGDVSHVCNASGTGYEDERCDPAQGSTCDAQTGRCDGACALHNIGSSYIGCDYYPTITGNPVGNAFQFAVAVANAATTAATVTIDSGGLTSPVTFTVAPGSVAVHELPWVSALKLCDGTTTNACTEGNQAASARVPKGAFHLRSTQPVTVYQFSPLDYAITGTGYSYSNDASLLLPTNAWRDEYYTASFQEAGNQNPGEMAVVAHQDGTAVTIMTRANTTGSATVTAFTAGTPQTVMLDAGDVIQLTSVVTTGADLTGTHVIADKPVQVFGGHYCAKSPNDNFAFCDHLEESMFSLDALGTEYVISAPAVPSIPGGKAQVVRIIGTVAGTKLTYDPPQAGAPTTIAQPGDFVQLVGTTASFRVTADHKILLAQYMEGQTAGGNTGDPAMALAVPVAQFRTSYLFHAPTNYVTNYVDVIAPTGAVVTLDGAAVTFTAIGATGYGLARVAALGAGPGGDGNHGITGTMPFGITVYGYGDYTSYWYAGGLDLTDIIVN